MTYLGKLSGCWVIKKMEHFEAELKEQKKHINKEQSHKKII